MNDLNVSLGANEIAFATAVARRFFHDPQDAADVAQDALLAAHRHRASFRGDSKLTTWLHRIVVTTALGRLRKQRRRPACESLDDGAAAEVAAAERSPEAQVGDAEVVALVRRALGAMGDGYQRVVELRFEDGLSEVEAAAALAMTVANVKIRTHRARRALARELAPALAA
jgi:RNA polymerase sigma-70 factor (ECF subfamily)